MGWSLINTRISCCTKGKKTQSNQNQRKKRKKRNKKGLSIIERERRGEKERK
jgi:hypothetical protein